MIISCRAMERFMPLCATARSTWNGRLPLTFEFRKLLRIPKEKMVGELADGVIAVTVLPASLFGCHALDSNVHGDEPACFVVRASELVEENAFEGRRRFRFGEAEGQR